MALGCCAAAWAEVTGRFIRDRKFARGPYIGTNIPQVVMHILDPQKLDNS